jgi:Outer membrane protein/protective antigen OMA87
VDGTVGSDLINLHAELRQPLSSSFGYYVAPYLEFQRRYANLYDDSGNVKVTQYSLQTEVAGLDFGVPLARLGDFRIGVAYAHGFASPQYNLPLDDGLNSPLLFPDIYGRQLSARARLVIDQLDDPLFARKGYFGELRVERSLFAGSDSFHRGVRQRALSRRAMDGTASTRASKRVTTFGGTNLTNPFGFTLGGFQHLSAYAADQLSGNSMVYGQVTYMNQLATFNASPIRGLFAGLSLKPATSGPAIRSSAADR